MATRDLVLPAAGRLLELKASGRPILEPPSPGNTKTSLYRPGADDLQSAHAQAEVYFVLQGCGTIEVPLESRRIEQGDLIHVPAGEAHVFCGSDLVVWALLFGDELSGEWGDQAESLCLWLPEGSPSRVWRLDHASGVAELGLVVRDRMVCAQYTEEAEVGVVAYRRSEEGLFASWAHTTLAPTVPGGGTAERLEGAPSGFAGRYRIQYTTGDGAAAGPPYELTIEPREGRVFLTWVGDAGPLEGIGVVDQDRLLASWRAPSSEAMEATILHLPEPGGPGQLEALTVSSEAPMARRIWTRPS